MKKMVLGFMFSGDLSDVVLIRKRAPEWQAGLMNGVGGKVEEGESEEAAMVREFEEETGVKTHRLFWKEFAFMFGRDWSVACFYAVSDLAYDCKTMEREEVSLHCSTNLPGSCVHNLHWLIPLALDEKRPVLVSAKYSE